MIPLVLLFILELLASSGSVSQRETKEWLYNTPTMESENVRLSDFEFTEGIDDEAAMVFDDGTGTKEISLCGNLPQILWWYILGAYLLLLGFNFYESYRISSQVSWRFEILLTLAFLGIWQGFDICQHVLWFPWTVLKLGLIMYLIAEVLALADISHKASMKKERE